MLNEVLYESIEAQFSEEVNNYSDIYLIIAPPRTASTAVARVFWNFPGVSKYSHEPFEKYYYESTGIETVTFHLRNPLDVARNSTTDKKPSLVIKEMSFQVGDHFPKLASLTKHPILFLIRDPRLAISSRIMKKVEGGLPLDYPLRENGWDDLKRQVEIATRNNYPFYILDTGEFRASPDIYVQALCTIYGVPFSEHMLRWESCDNLALDNLNGKHSHLYKRVLSSTGVEPQTEPILSFDDFPEIHGIKEYVRYAYNIYCNLRNDQQLIQYQHCQAS